MNLCTCCSNVPEKLFALDIIFEIYKLLQKSDIIQLDTVLAEVGITTESTGYKLKFLIITKT